MNPEPTISFQRILVTGGTGFLGHHVVPALKSALDCEVIALGKRDVDLLVPGAADEMLATYRPDAVLHLAAKVGGIIANRDYPADFYFENIIMNTQTFQACFKAGIRKLVTFIGGCSYPGSAPSPISETAMWDGFPQGESAPYSTAKKMMLVQSAAYRKQHGFNSVTLVPGNVYGEHDNFNEEYSHVIPAMIRRFIEARDAEAPSVTCFGSGRPTRDFVYAGDVAKVVPWFFKHYDSSDPVNISSGTRTSIRELAESVKAATGYQGQIEWDTGQPDGQMDKIFDVARLHELGLSCDTPLVEGLRKTADWFLSAREEGLVRL